MINYALKVFAATGGGLLFVIASLNASDARNPPDWVDDPLYWINAPRFHERAEAARKAHQTGNDEQAIKLYNEALGMHPFPNAKRLALIRRGNAFVDYNSPDQAINDFNEALHLGACRCCIFVDRGLALELKGRIDDAQREYARAIAVDPGFAGAYYNRGNLYFEDGDYTNALRDFSKAVELNRGDLDSLVERASTYLRLQKNEEALADVDSALQVNPHFTRALVVRAEVYARLGNVEWARRDISAASESISENATKYELEAIAWRSATSPSSSLRDGKRAIRYASRACSLDHWRNSGFITGLAAAYAESGDFKTATRYQELALRSTPRYEKYIKEQQERLASYRNRKPYRDVIK